MSPPVPQPKVIKAKAPKKVFALKKFQEPSAILVADFLKDISDKTGVCLQGGTGSGKTFVLAAALKQAQDAGLYLQNPDKPFKIYSILFLCPKNCIIQQERVLRLAGVQDFLVTSYDSLRTDFGEMFLDWQTVKTSGIEEIVPRWNPDFAPDVIVCDESQYLKNFSSQRGKVIKEYERARLGKVVLASATHFQKACEAEYAVLGCGIIPHSKDFPEYSWTVSPSGPTANSPTAIERIREDLESRGKWIKITGVKYPFKPIIENKKLPLNLVKRRIYDSAYARYLEERRKLGKNDPSGILAKLNAMREFQKTSELLMADEIAVISQHIKESYNNSIIYGTNFIDSLLAVKKFLLKNGVKESEISELHGRIPANKKQGMIDNFQDGKTRYFLTTLKSGGTGLSLHHELESSFPRTMLMRLPWSIYEFVQFLGRGQRITNLSPVKQYLLSYADTIEEDVAIRLDEKLKCISKLLERKDNFIMDIFNKEVDNDLALAVEQEATKDEEEDEEMVFDNAILDGEN